MTGTETATFKDLGIKEELCENLKLLGIEQPTHIQVFWIRDSNHESLSN